jgi:hypothetical protein
MAKKFLGTGWAFPVRVNGQGGNALVSGEENIKQSCLIILSTALGERAMRPDFGCGIYDLVFDPADASLAGRIEFFVANALEAWEPRITVKSVEAEMTEEKVIVEVRYIIRSTNTEDNFVYPYFIAGAA